MLVICAAEVGGGIWAYLNRSKLKDGVQTGNYDDDYDYDDDDDDDIVLHPFARDLCGGSWRWNLAISQQGQT